MVNPRSRVSNGSGDSHGDSVRAATEPDWCGVARAFRVVFSRSVRSKSAGISGESARLLCRQQSWMPRIQTSKLRQLWKRYSAWIKIIWTQKDQITYTKGKESFGRISMMVASVGQDTPWPMLSHPLDAAIQRPQAVSTMIWMTWMTQEKNRESDCLVRCYPQNNYPLVMSK